MMKIKHPFDTDIFENVILPLTGWIVVVTTTIGALLLMAIPFGILWQVLNN